MPVEDSRLLRNALVDMVTVEEAVLLNSYWPHAERPVAIHQRRLCDILVDEVPRHDLSRLKRARRALGYAWWGALPYSSGLRPGQRGPA